MKNETLWYKLHHYGFQFVLCSKGKIPVQKAWQDAKPEFHVIKAHEESGGLLGVVPGSSVWWVIDQDHGPKEQLLKDVPQICFSVPSSAEGRWHHWLRLPTNVARGSIGNKKWQIGECSGEIRCHKGFVVVWDVEKLSEGIDKHYKSRAYAPAGIRKLFPKEKKTMKPGAPHMVMQQTRTRDRDPEGKKLFEMKVPAMGEEYIMREVRRIREAKEGERNQTLNTIVYDMYLKGLGTDEYEEMMIEAAMDAGLHEDEIYATVQSARRGGIAECMVPGAYDGTGGTAGTGEDNGANGVLSAVIKKADGDAHVYDNFKISTIEQAIKDIGYELRFNVLSSRPEARKLGDEEWMDLSNSGVRIRRALEDHCWLERKTGLAPYFVTKDRLYDMLDNLEDDEEYHAHPIDDWRKTLPDWDQKPRIATMFHDALGVRQDHLAAWSGFYMMCAPLIRAVTNGGEGFSLDQMLFLIGPQGVGKSKFIRESLPLKMRLHMVNQHYDPNWDEKTQVEAMIGKFFVEASELKITRHFSIETLKARLSATHDETRLAYGRRTKRFPRSATMIATMNDLDGVPDDPTGNRRFITLWCPGVAQNADISRGGYHVHDYWETNREQLWAEAFVARDKIVSGALSLEIVDQAREQRDEAYSAARSRDEHLEDVMDEILDRLESAEHRMTEFGDETQFLPGVRLPEIVTSLQNAGVEQRALDRRASTALRRRGYLPKTFRVRSGEDKVIRRWYKPDA